MEVEEVKGHSAGARLYRHSVVGGSTCQFLSRAAYLTQLRKCAQKAGESVGLALLDHLLSFSPIPNAALFVNATERVGVNLTNPDARMGMVWLHDILRQTYVDGSIGC